MARQFRPGQLRTGSLYDISSSFALTASYAANAGTTINTGSFITTASFNAFTASYTTGSFTGSFTGTVTGTASFATTASYVSSNFQYEIHVSQIDGNDTTGDGSLLKPVATVTKALTLLGASRKTIIIHPGTYSENVTVADTNTTISTSELTGANTLLSGTLTIGTLGSGTRISGLKMSSLVISGTAQAYISNCTVDNQVTKSSSGYVEIINSELQCISGIQISGAGITIINGNKNVAVSVSNASAQVIIKGCNSVVTPSASAGNLTIVDCIVTALGGNGITITGASTTLTLLNSQVLVTAGNNVAPISVAGIYSIINTIYDKPGSSLTGISTNSIDYFQYIDADNVNTKGLSVTGSITVSGSVINNLTASYAISASQALSSSFATSASYATNALNASYAANGGVTQLLAGLNVILSPTNGLGQVTVSATLSGSTIFNTATGSYGSFYDTTTQTNPVANIPRSMSFNSTDITNGVSISGSTSPFDTYIKTQNAGVYNIQFSAQLDKTDSGVDEVVIWLRKNGTDLTDSATTITLSGNNDKQVAAWNWFVQSAADDYYQIIWSSADTNLRLLAEPISGTHPGIPSVILTANRIDQFLSNTGSFSGSFTGIFTGSLSGTSSYATQALSASFAPSSPPFPYTGSARITGSLGVTGSFSVYNQNANYTVLDTNTGTLRGTNTSSSIDWLGRELFDTNGKRSVFWRNRIGYDANESSSIEWNARQLKDGFGTIAADWSFGRRELYDRYTTQSINWDSRYAVDTNASKSLYWGTRELYNSSNIVVVNWESRVAYDGASLSSIDWGARAAYDTNVSRSVFWDSRELYNSSNIAVVDWENQILSDPSSIQSINWDTRALFDAAGNSSINWQSRQLNDASNNLIISYDPTNGQQRTDQLSYHNYYTANGTEGESFIDWAFNNSTLNVAGETLGFGANIDPAILKGELCSLGEDGIWNITDQTNVSSSAMLGICVEPWNKSVMITEGTVTVVTASGYTDIPFVEGTSFHGKPVYIRSGSLGGLTTTKPTSGYVRVVGHMYYNSTSYTDYWLMKFRPSNDWYQI
jgi:hypothetical protein